MNHSLIRVIETAQRSIERFALAGFSPAQSIERQIIWCWSRATGESTEPLPAPLCMAYLMESGFEKFGAYPLLAQQLRCIESEMRIFEMEHAEHSEYAALAA